MEKAGAEEPRRQPQEEVKKEEATGQSSSAPRRKRTDLTPEEQKARREFIDAALAEVKAYGEMTVEEVEDEYRQAGKLHRFDLENEWKKRFAKVARKHPPPEGLIPELGEYLKLLEDDEKN